MKTKAQIVKELREGFERQGYAVARGPVEIKNEEGEVILIAENRITYTGQRRLPLGGDA